MMMMYPLNLLSFSVHIDACLPSLKGSDLCILLVILKILHTQEVLIYFNQLVLLRPNNVAKVYQLRSNITDFLVYLPIRLYHF